MARKTIVGLETKITNLEADNAALEEMHERYCEQSDLMSNENGRLSQGIEDRDKEIKLLNHKIAFLELSYDANLAGERASITALEAGLANVLGLEIVADDC
ncbi:MAG: hypothetical protein ACI9H6_000226 [Patiriisocius sp.]|jgi:hypothetical protein